jgi:hypothetical protein
VPDDRIAHGPTGPDFTALLLSVERGGGSNSSGGRPIRRHRINGVLGWSGILK